MKRGMMGRKVFDKRFPNVKYWIGEGANRCTLTISWNEDKQGLIVDCPDHLTWGFCWDGDATLLDMVDFIAKTDPRLLLLRQYVGVLGNTVCGIGYDETPSKLRVIFDADLAKANVIDYLYSVRAQWIANQAIATGKTTGIINHPFDANTGNGYPAYDYDYWTIDRRLFPNTHWSAGMMIGSWLVYQKSYNDTTWSWSEGHSILIKEHGVFLTKLENPITDAQCFGLSFTLMDDWLSTPPREQNPVSKP